MKRLAGRTALVTGGAVRVGRTLSLRLAALGADVAMLAREETSAAADTAREIAALGGRAVVVAGDLLHAETPARAIAEATEALGPVDILVNNAAIFESGDLADLELEAWSRMQRINLRAPLLLARAFADALPADRAGDIVNLNDVHALRPRGGYFAYTHSKAALHALTRNLAAQPPEPGRTRGAHPGRRRRLHPRVHLRQRLDGDEGGRLAGPVPLSDHAQRERGRGVRPPLPLPLGLKGPGALPSRS